EQGSEALGGAVVRSSRQEELVLEVWREQADGLGAKRVGGILAPTCGGTVVGLVHDQHVVAAGIDGLALCGQCLTEEPKGPLSLEKVDRCDQPREVTPWVDVNAPFASQVTHQFAIDDAEVEPELVPHLVPPLDLKRSRADDEYSARTVADDEFERDEPRLDGLAQAHVVGDQEVDPRHLDGPDDRIELIVLDVDARTERRLDVPQVGCRSSSPSNGIEKGIEPVR